MSQATLLGICSDNVITILTPSSTIECGPFSDVVSTTALAAGPVTGPLVFTLPLSSPDRVLVTGSLQIMFSNVPASWTTGPPLTYLRVQLGSDPATVINRYIIFHYYSGSYSQIPVDMQFSFLATGPTTITVTPINAGGSVTLQGSLWFQRNLTISNSCCH
jgi:hypothetical protein